MRRQRKEKRKRKHATALCVWGPAALRGRDVRRRKGERGEGIYIHACIHERINIKKGKEKRMNQDFRDAIMA